VEQAAASIADRRSATRIQGVRTGFEGIGRPRVPIDGDPKEMVGHRETVHVSGRGARMAAGPAKELS
jgi:hypothetical protein